jgi:hypothetical protein
LPVVDRLATEYAEEVAFVAPAWKGTAEDTAERAAEILPSGNVQWGLDAGEEIFSAYAVPYQPVTVLVTGSGMIFDRWAGALEEAELRERIEALVAGP